MTTSELMAFIIEYFDDAQNLPSIAISVWSSELNKLSDVQRSQLVVECCKLPKGASIYPARLLEMAGYESEEVAAWNNVQGCLHQGNLEGLTPAAYSACKEIGMTCRWKHIENRELPQLRSIFIEAVKGYLNGTKTLFHLHISQNALPESEPKYMSQSELKQRIAAFKAEQQMIREREKRERLLAIVESFPKNLQ
jgi:hypothetical protein